MAEKLQDSLEILSKENLNTPDTSGLYDSAERVLELYKFSDYKVQEYKGKLAKINYKSHSIARMYKTVITDTYNKEGINFAGKYCFVSWGSGTSLQACAIVDAITGKVYEGPWAQTGYDFNKNSKLLIVNAYFYQSWDYLQKLPEIYVFENDSFARIN